VVGGNLAGDRGRHHDEGGDLMGGLDGDLAVVLGAACWAAAFCVVGDSRATGTDIAACGGLMEGKKQARFCALGGVRRSWVEQLVSIRWVGLVLSKSYIIERI
jgi:hypothetical protein